MKLWIIRPVENLQTRDNPWEPWIGYYYDHAFGFVVRAKNEKEAREFASEQAGIESNNNKDIWKNKNYSTCIELKKDGESGVILRDYMST
jgi:hypothetical protein